DWREFADALNPLSDKAKGDALRRGPADHLRRRLRRAAPTTNCVSRPEAGASRGSERLHPRPQRAEQDAQELLRGVEPLAGQEAIAGLEDADDPKRPGVAALHTAGHVVLLQQPELADPLRSQRVAEHARPDVGEEVLVVDAHVVHPAELQPD